MTVPPIRLPCSRASFGTRRADPRPFGRRARAAPLFDVDGRCAFFLGGQINCSTTVHSFTDILRILSVSDDPTEDVDIISERAMQPAPKSRKGRFRSFWNMSHKDKLEVRKAGMESGLLKRIEKMSLATQMKLFYTAYSRVSIDFRGNTSEPLLLARARASSLTV